MRIEFDFRVTCKEMPSKKVSEAVVKHLMKQPKTPVSQGHLIKVMEAEENVTFHYDNQLVTAYSFGRNSEILLWIDAARPASSQFIVVLVFTENRMRLDLLALKVFDHIVKSLPHGCSVQDHHFKILVPNLCHTFIIVEESPPFLTDEGKGTIAIAVGAAVVISILLFVSPPEAEPFKAIYQSGWGVLINILSSAVFALLTLLWTWRRRQKSAKQQRRVVYSDAA